MSNQPPQYGQQPGYYQQPVPAAPAPQSGINGMGLASLIIGVVGLAICWIPWIGFAGILVGLIGLVFGVLGIALEKYRGRRMLGIIGTVVNGIAFLLSTFLPVITGLWWTWAWLDDSGVIDEFQTRVEQEYETFDYDDYSSDAPQETFESGTPQATPGV